MKIMSNRIEFIDEIKTTPPKYRADILEELPEGGL